MAAFSLSLPDNKILTGDNYFPEVVAAAGISTRPLIIALHGGSYTSSYFDADEKHSIRHVSQSLGVPVISINRPGYFKSSPLPDIPAGSSYIQEQARYLHETILPSLWKQHASALDVSSIFLYAHSIGGAIAVIAASLHDSSAKYPLCGLSISGVGSNVQRLPFPQFELPLAEMKNVQLSFPNPQKDAIMLGPLKCYDPVILKQTDRLQHQISLEELYDINVLWVGYWRKYAAGVQVPTLYTQGEHDALWNSTDQDVEDFAAGFVHSPTVESKRLLSAPHCIELSLQATGIFLRTFGFAIESAVWLKLENET